MNALAVTLPAGPGEPTTEETFPNHVRSRLRYDLGLALNELRTRSATFQQLSMGAWIVFIAIATRWQSNEEAWPSQETIARFCGCTSRFVRTCVAQLVLGGILRVRRTRTPLGTERLYYAPGRVLLRELAAIEERFPRERARPLRRAIRDATSGSSSATINDELPDLRSGGLPEQGSRELTDQDQEPSSCGDDATTTNEVDALEDATVEPTSDETEEKKVFSSFDKSTSDAAPPHVSEPTSSDEREGVSEAASTTSARPTSADAAPRVTEIDRAIAREVLGARMARKYPDRAMPRWFDRGEIEHVALCTSLLEGDRAKKIETHRRAIDSAFSTSRSGAPTVRFIWGSPDHFFDHVARGEQLERDRAAREARRASRSSVPPTVIEATPPSDPAELRARAAAVRTLLANLAPPTFSSPRNDDTSDLDARS
ncbi:MAG: helix-turn-helix domain-containing protein [Polyangiales bacterium]